MIETFKNLYILILYYIPFSLGIMCIDLFYKLQLKKCKSYIKAEYQLDTNSIQFWLSNSLSLIALISIYKPSFQQGFWVGNPFMIHYIMMFLCGLILGFYTWSWGVHIKFVYLFFILVSIIFILLQPEKVPLLFILNYSGVVCFAVWCNKSIIFNCTL